MKVSQHILPIQRRYRTSARNGHGSEPYGSSDLETLACVRPSIGKRMLRRQECPKLVNK